MNKLTMFIWGLTILMLCTLILIIGYRKQDKVFLDLSASLELGASRYVEKNNIKLKFNESSKIYIEDLIKDNYIEEDENIEKYCIDSVLVYKGLFGYKYALNENCEDKE